MPHPRTLAAILMAVLLCGGSAQAQMRRPPDRQLSKSAESLREAFADVIAQARKSTVSVLCDNAPTVLGTIVEADGGIVTKASELHGKIACKLADGRTLAARLVRVWEEHDLAMLKVEAADLPAIQWADGKVAVGQWVASAGTGALPIAVGVISVGRRRIPARSGMLGIMLGDVPDGLRVMQVVPDSAAARAGIQLDDVILALNGKPTPTREELAHVIADCPSGQTVKVLLRRGDKEVEVNATLGVRTPTTQSRRADMQNTLAGPVSKRASSFPAVLQHDTVLKPGECGGPLVDLDGKIVGLNIARAGRVESYATPADVVKSVVAQLKSPRPATTAATSKPR